MCVLSPLAYKKNKGLPYAKGGYADKEECRWSATTIIRILEDETYTGVLVQGKRGTPHYKLKEVELHPSSDWIRIPDAHEAIIDRQDFDLVQRIRHLDTRAAPDQKAVYLFSGVLICGCCGARMTRKTNRVKGKEYHYYYCPTGKKKGCAHPVMLKESVLAENIRNVLKGQIDNVVSLGAVLSGVDQIKINRQLADEYTSQVTENEKQIALALEFKARLYESMVQGMITREEFVSYKNKYTKQAEQLREANRDLQEKIRDVMENRSERNRWIRHFTKFATLDTLDRKAVVQLIQTITVYGKDELAIRFNYEDEYQKAKAMAEQVQLRKAG